MPLGSGDADPARGTAPLKPKPGLNEPSSQAGIAGSVVTAAQLLPLGPPSVKRAHGSGRARASAFSNVRETLPVSICNFRGSIWVRLRRSLGRGSLADQNQCERIRLRAQLRRI